MKNLEVRIQGIKRYWIEDGDFSWEKSRNLDYEDFLTAVYWYQNGKYVKSKIKQTDL